MDTVPSGRKSDSCRARSASTDSILLCWLALVESWRKICTDSGWIGARELRDALFREMKEGEWTTLEAEVAGLGSRKILILSIQLTLSLEKDVTCVVHPSHGSMAVYYQSFSPVTEKAGCSEMTDRKKPPDANAR